MKKTGLYIILGVLCVGAAAYSGVRVFQQTYAPPAITESAVVTPSPTPSAPPEPTPTPTDPPPTAEPTPVPTPTPTPYVSPVDFDSLQAVNPDIYGWLEMYNAGISLPIVQDPENDEFYLNHNSDRAYSANGAVFSEATYNTADFSDPVVVLYGHHMRDGAIFGNLQRYYSDSVFFDENPTFTVYAPDRTLTYGVFAAVPYPGDHILYYHDFTNDDVFQTFFREILETRDLSARFNEAYAPEPGDHVLILSTCLIGNNTNRFLVMGTLLDDQ